MRVSMVVLAIAAVWGSVTSQYTPRIGGQVAGFRLAGVEPDGDPLDQVLLNVTLSSSGTVPRLHLIVDSYLENFKSDTTPILPDLLHPTRTAHNLGGFLDGKALLTDDAGDVLYNGTFLAEAFLDNSNHGVVTLQGVHAARGGRADLKGRFTLDKAGALHGRLAGRISLPAAARSQIAQHAGAPMRKLQAIIGGVSVRPHPMVGRSSSGSSAPLHTGYGPAPSSGSGRKISPLTIIAGLGAILSFLLAVVVWWWQRRERQRAVSDI